MQRITIGYSPCPNDTFIFGGLAKGLINSPIEYDIVLEDVEYLNKLALKGELMATKLSYHAFAHVIDAYEMLPYGSALGFGVGPLLITSNENLEMSDINSIAIPGKYTTANMLLQFAIDKAVRVEEVLFSDIEACVQSGKVDAGVIIHENRFTYKERGFHKLMDLGDHWEKKTGYAIPLGGIAIRRDLEQSTKNQILNDLKRSIALADEQFDLVSGYIKIHAQEMDVRVMKQHIDLYVNESTRGLSSEDCAAVEHLLKVIIGANNRDNDSLQWKFENSL